MILTPATPLRSLPVKLLPRLRQDPPRILEQWEIKGGPRC